MIKGPQYSLNIWGRTLKSARIQFSTVGFGYRNPVNVASNPHRYNQWYTFLRAEALHMWESNVWTHRISSRSSQTINQMLWLLIIFLIPVLIIFLKSQYKLYIQIVRDIYINCYAQCHLRWEYAYTRLESLLSPLKWIRCCDRWDFCCYQYL